MKNMKCQLPNINYMSIFRRQNCSSVRSVCVWFCFVLNSIFCLPLTSHSQGLTLVSTKTHTHSLFDSHHLLNIHTLINMGNPQTSHPTPTLSVSASLRRGKNRKVIWLFFSKRNIIFAAALFLPILPSVDLGQHSWILPAPTPFGFYCLQIQTCPRGKESLFS